MSALNIFKICLGMILTAVVICGIITYSKKINESAETPPHKKIEQHNDTCNFEIPKNQFMLVKFHNGTYGLKRLDMYADWFLIQDGIESSWHWFTVTNIAAATFKDTCELKNKLMQYLNVVHQYEYKEVK